MSGITTTSTLAVLIDKRPMRKRRRSAKKRNVHLGRVESVFVMANQNI